MATVQGGSKEWPVRTAGKAAHSPTKGHRAYALAMEPMNGSGSGRASMWKKPVLGLPAWVPGDTPAREGRARDPAELG